MRDGLRLDWGQDPKWFFFFNFNFESMERATSRLCTTGTVRLPDYGYATEARFDTGSNRMVQLWVRE
jgi:hypothetical protein